MNDTQILSIAIMVVAVLAGAFFNNARISDVIKLMEAKTDMLRAEMAKNHSEMLHRFGDLDNRMTDVESRLGRLEDRFLR